MNKLRIESDGTLFGTQVFVTTDDGPVQLPNVRRVDWRCKADEGMSLAEITVDSVEIAGTGFGDASSMCFDASNVPIPWTDEMEAAQAEVDAARQKVTALTERARLEMGQQ